MMKNKQQFYIDSSSLAKPQSDYPSAYVSNTQQYSGGKWQG
jgi:hypothetical protein